MKGATSNFDRDLGTMRTAGLGSATSLMVGAIILCVRGRGGERSQLSKNTSAPASSVHAFTALWPSSLSLSVAGSGGTVVGVFLGGVAGWCIEGFAAVLFRDERWNWGC